MIEHSYKLDGSFDGCLEIGLPDKCGQIFKIIFLESLPTDQIAERLGINVLTLRTQKARAISLIRTALLNRGRLATLVDAGLLFRVAKGTSVIYYLNFQEQNTVKSPLIPIITGNIFVAIIPGHHIGELVFI